ncbi:MAG: guanine deaminase [Gammaproteobacteria bacterium]|nr:guanine deaminase [Gammaproteobacteria bacterium]MDH5302971.1 guanine deaminase [Gammaproteobacteria bacterium]MDH5321282.1 guanine deaminase [Gammaproteobacteria bacterium]
MSSITAIRGAALSYSQDPFQNAVEDCFRYEADALIIMQDGRVIAFGPASEIVGTLAGDVEVTRYDNCLILPGFIDCHVHYPQTEIIGAYGKHLLDWLQNYTFIAEQKFKDRDHAHNTAKVFLRESIRCGTTTSAVFCTVDPISVDAFFAEAQKLNMRNIAGKVLMDRNAPPELLDTPQQGYDQTQALIDRWHGKGRALYGVTPRFAPTSSPEQMEMTASVWHQNPGTYLQSHVSETASEVAWVKELFPACRNYVDVYAHFGQLGERCILGHGVHLSEDEFAELHESGTAIAHCPTSNLFLGSGLFEMSMAVNPRRPVRVGLATDLGAGTNFSQLVTMNEAYKIAQLRGYALSAHHAYYLATRGAARALYLEDKIGSIAVGMEADLVVLDLAATPVLGYRMQHTSNLEEMLFVLMTLGDDRTACATYIAGERVYSRELQVRKEMFVPSLQVE